MKAADLFSPLPPEWPEDLTGKIQAQIRDSNRAVVVLDDDPTGTQTVHDVTVLTAWPVDLLSQALAQSDTCFYILTNSRSLPSAEARAVTHEIARNLLFASRQVGREFVVVSRSDSTLRGHYPVEIQALEDFLPSDAHLIVPAFFEAGRVTVNSVHWVQEVDEFIPAAETESAKDRDFPYHHSDLRLWVAEKSGGQWPPESIAEITLEDIRIGGPDRVSHKLRIASGAVVVNAVSYRDLEVLVTGLLQVEAEGRHLLYRTAASFVRVRAGITPRGLLDPTELSLPKTNNGGLIVVGSYVQRTSRQLESALELSGIEGIELDVEKVLDAAQREVEIRRVAARAQELIEQGSDALIYTSRSLITEGIEGTLLRIGKQVSTALVDVVSRLAVTPRFIIAKGGITSSDVATQGLRVRSARVTGQIQPGVPVWELGADSRFPGMNYVVFPGNVGTEATLAVIIEQMRRRED